MASRVAGRPLRVFEAAELVAAEVLSALPAVEEDEAPDDVVEPGREEAGGPDIEHVQPSALCARRPVRLDAELQALVENLANADAFELDARLRAALAREQSLEARVAPLLILAWQPGVHRTLGFTTRETWVRERLGMDPTRARALVRLERACAESPALARAWRGGSLSWVKAGALVPLVSADPLGRFVEDWVQWAGRITVRRLREDAERALLLAEVDPETFRREGGLPPEARRCAFDESHAGTRGGREIGAIHRDRQGVSGAAAGSGRDGDAAEGADREIRAIHRSSQGVSHAAGGGDGDGGNAAGEAGRGFGAPTMADDNDEGLPRYLDGLAARAHAGLDGKPRPDEVCWVRLAGSRDVVRLFRTALCTVRRRIEAEAGRLPTAGEALDAMLDHAFAAWGVDEKVPARHRVFERDGWRCAAPGCSSMQNLHDHHVRFRSAGGSDALENRVTLCAFHHLRGVHVGRVRCVGRAPEGLTWQLGIRRGARPLLAYRSGDIRIGASAASRRPSLTVHSPTPAV